MAFLSLIFWNNLAKEWLTALVVSLTVMIFLRLVKWGLACYFSEKTQHNKWDVVELSAAIANRNLMPFVFIFALYAGLQVIDLPQRLLPWIFNITMAP